MTITELPVTKHLSDEDLKKALLTPLVLPNFPCQTTSVERCMQLVSEASKQVYGEAERHGLILSRVNSGEERAGYDTKKDYSLKYSEDTAWNTIYALY